MKVNRNLVSFIVVCLAWGSTFAALKASLAGLPPFLLAGLRFLIAGIILLGLRPRTSQLPSLKDGLMILMLAQLVITINYGLLFWGTQYLPSGLSGVISFAAVALALTLFAALLKQERLTPQISLGLLLGLAGLGLLILPILLNTASSIGVQGILAILIGSAFYGLGSLWTRPYTRRCGAITISSWQMLSGGLCLILISLLGEGSVIKNVAGLGQTEVWLGLVYLIVVGSLLGFTLYQQLLTRWSISRLATYNFICPGIAIVLGIVLFQERFSWLEAIAMLLLLLGIILIVWRKAGARQPAKL